MIVKIVLDWRAAFPFVAFGAVGAGVTGVTLGTLVAIWTSKAIVSTLVAVKSSKLRQTGFTQRGREARWARRHTRPALRTISRGTLVAVGARIAVGALITRPAGKLRAADVAIQT